MSGNKVATWSQRQIQEIQNHKEWALFGAALCAVHIVTRFFWFSTFSPEISSSLVPKVCWSFLPNCELIAIPGFLKNIVGQTYLITAVVGACCFLNQKIRAGWWILLGLNLFKYVILIGDFARMGNYHYMPFVISFCFLFISRKDWLIPILIVLFYVAAGTLKLNIEWLSGANFFSSGYIGDFWLQWLCAFVVVLELVLVWGLLQKSAKVRWITLFLLACFHSYSAFIVGYFYPLVMACLLSIFPLLWWRSRFFQWRNPGKVPLIVVGIFLFCQVLPYLQKGDPVLMGRGRVFSLSMFDGSAVCSVSLLLKYENATYEIKPSDLLGFSAPRTRCNPMAFWSFARSECKKNKNIPGFVDMDFVMTSRRSTDSFFTPLVAAENFCAKESSFSLLFPNDWML